MKKSKFDWGTIIKPTKKCLDRAKRCGLNITKNTFAISLGKNRNNEDEISLVILGHHTIDRYLSEDWMVK